MATNSWGEYLSGLSTSEIVSEVQRIERVCQSLDVSCVNVGYASDPESIAFAYEKLGFGKFGCQGTLAVSAIVTGVLKSLSVKTCGYSGLMLPVCEDFGLAERANEGTYGLTNLLLYSAVCGCGLDTVPIPGSVTVGEIEAILLDVAALAIKLDKPLSARLFPVPGKEAGEMTAFNSPFLVDCRILKV